ncbi:type ISP restriction/modification enzyme [Streptomyces silvisoli]|uniref:DNA methyltransferase n=1 Tax=Streptomyces silvisoli TaxID=3034235 RepID=A0ABT5ZKR0_9ACTN|nr:type ISP restriction/modification enzyme [Streptomyces silvisoli]MDF3290399.1 DNA methyltransferase [Streptomyces silvisoli]
MRAVSDDAPLLDDLMPWSTAPPRFGRSWVLAPDPRSLRARWETLLRAGTVEQRDALFHPTRARSVHSTVAQLPGHPAPTGTLAEEQGPCPEPLRVLHGPYDQQWLIPDHRLLDTARTELWRVADERQVFAVEQAHVPQVPGPAVVCSTLLPDGHSPAGRPGRIRPLYRRPGGVEPNVAPGLLDHLGKRCERQVSAEDLLAWITVCARQSPVGRVVPLPANGELWDVGVELGRTALDVQTRGARSGVRPRLPGGRRPYVRAPLPARPDALRYDEQEEALLVGEGRISPVPRGAWEFHAGGVRVLEAWFEARAGAAEPGTLAAIGPGAWPQEWTSDLLELVTVLALLSELRTRQTALAAALDRGPRTGTAELRAAGVLPVPASARRPASVLDHPEEGPGGQFALL